MIFSGCVAQEKSAWEQQKEKMIKAIFVNHGDGWQGWTEKCWFDIKTHGLLSKCKDNISFL